MATKSTPALKLEAIKQFVARPLSCWEYFQACTGTHPQTLDGQREVILSYEGHGSFDPIIWQQALTVAIRENPASRIRLAGKRKKSHWVGDGCGPTLRVIAHSGWNGDHSRDAEFIVDTPMSLERGVTSELILVHAKRSYVIFRVHHAVMDGIGAAHFMQEVFRALRGEPLLGTNAIFSDADLTANIVPDKTANLRSQGADATGGAQGDEKGNSWRRISLTGPQSKLLERTALAVAEYARRFSDSPTCIAIPVSLRRYMRDIVSTMNFTSIMYVDIQASDSIDAVHISIKSSLAKHAEITLLRLLKFCKYFPLPWFDKFTARTHKNYRKGIGQQTAFISNLGVFNSADFCGGDFIAERLFVIPPVGVAYIVLSTLDENVEITILLPDVYGSDGRLEEYTNFIKERLLST